MKKYFGTFFRDFSLKCLPDWSAGIIIDFKTLNRERRFTVAVYWEKEPAARRKGRTAASLLLFIGKVREACCCERSEQEHEFL